MDPNITIFSCNQYKVLMKYFESWFLSEFSKSGMYFTLTVPQFGEATFQVHDSHMWPVATALDGSELEHWGISKKIKYFFFCNELLFTCLLSLHRQENNFFFYQRI